MQKTEENQKKEPKNGKKFKKLLTLLIVIIFAFLFVFLEKQYSKPRTFEKTVTFKVNDVDEKLENGSLKIPEKKPIIKTTIEDKDFTQDILIEELQEKIQELEIKFDQIHLNSNLPKILLSFFELRSQIELEENYELKLQEFSILTAKDINLNSKANELAKVLRRKNYKISDISQELDNSIRQIMLIKSKGDDSKDFINKLKNMLATVVLIRRIDGKVTNKSDEIDLKILEIEELLEKGYYSEILEIIKDFDEKYQTELKNFTKMVEIQATLNEISDEILVYLKTVTNN